MPTCCSCHGPTCLALRPASNSAVDHMPDTQPTRNYHTYNSSSASTMGYPALVLLPASNSAGRQLTSTADPMPGGIQPWR
jgi:hypothetical protein